MSVDVSPMIGDNRHSPAADARAAMLDVISQRQARIDELVANLQQRTVMRDRVDAANATDVVGIARQVIAAIDEQRKAISSPYDEAAGAPIIIRRAALLVLEQEMDRVIGLLEVFADQQAARVAAQRQEQDAAQAQLREVNAPRQEIIYGEGGPVPTSPPPTPVTKPTEFRGDYGHRFTRREKIDVEITDMARIPLEFLDTDAVREAVAKGIKERASKNSRLEVTGATIHRGKRGTVI